MERPQKYIYEFDDFRVDPGRRLLLEGDGRPLPLTPKAFDTLIYLVQHSDVVLGKETLMRAIWGEMHLRAAPRARRETSRAPLHCYGSRTGLQVRCTRDQAQAACNRKQC